MREAPSSVASVLQSLKYSVDDMPTSRGIHCGGLTFLSLCLNKNAPVGKGRASISATSPFLTRNWHVTSLAYGAAYLTCNTLSAASRSTRAGRVVGFFVALAYIVASANSLLSVSLHQVVVEGAAVVGVVPSAGVISASSSETPLGRPFLTGAEAPKMSTVAAVGFGPFGLTVRTVSTWVACLSVETSVTFVNDVAEIQSLASCSCESLSQ